MAQTPRNRTDEEWRSLKFEAGRIFTPLTPIGIADLFSGRREQISNLVDTVAERGRHALIYGEPGVGKTSLAQIIQHLIPVERDRIKYIRKSAFSGDTFSTTWLSIFRDLKFSADLGEGERNYPLSDLYKDGVLPSDVVRELSFFADSDVPIIVIDEYNLVRDHNSSKQMAETIKAVSDEGINVTIIVVGISDTVENLIAGHGSLDRCAEEVLMPRMGTHELQVLLESRVGKLGMKIDGDAKWKIINLSKGLPAFAHALGRGAVISAIETRSTKVVETSVNHAIEDWLRGSQNTLKSDYEQAIRSNHHKARFRQIITACALAKTDESGYFTAKQVQDPLSDILKKPIGIDGFNPNLKELASVKRGDVLQQIGSERIYRYRFSNPAMQPYVIMKGIQDGLLDAKATSALSAPEQGLLFASE